MTRAGQIVLFYFPQTNLTQRKLRPALLIDRLPGAYDDWPICMISSQIRHCVEGFDEVISEDAPDFSSSGLRTASVVRVGRLAVVEASMLLGSIGEVAPERLARIKAKLARWLTQTK